MTARRYHPPEITVSDGLSTSDERRLSAVVRDAIGRAIVDDSPQFLLADLPATSPARQQCPPRAAGEVAQSRTRAGILPKNVEFDAARNRLTVFDFAVGSSTLPPDVTTDPDWQFAMSLIAGNTTASVAVDGYTDCAGTNSENEALRQQRAEAVIAALPAALRPQATRFRFFVGSDFLATNDSPEGRAHNRAAQLTLSLDLEQADRITEAHNLDEYLLLVQALEKRLNLTRASDVRTALSVLRQIYYGSPIWSLSHNAGWDFVITQHPWNPKDNPAAALHPALADALRKSQVVEGIDVGHILTGIDAMLAPDGVVAFGSVTLIPNEEWATWAGDVGSAASEWALAAWGGRATADERGVYFRRFAGDADLVGDIEAFAVRVGLNGGAPGSQLGQPIKLTGPLSTMLRTYFRVTSGPLGTARERRVLDFIQAYGGIVAAGTIVNRDELAGRLRVPVDRFAQLSVLYEWSKNRLPDPQPGAPGIRTLLDPAITFMTEQFVDWLARFAATGAPWGPTGG